MSKAARKTRRRKAVVEVGLSGPSIADYYRFKLSLPNATQPTYEEFHSWRTRV